MNYLPTIFSHFSVSAWFCSKTSPIHYDRSSFFDIFHSFKNERSVDYYIGLGNFFVFFPGKSLKIQNYRSASIYYIFKCGLYHLAMFKIFKLIIFECLTKDFLHVQAMSYIAMVRIFLRFSISVQFIYRV